MDIDPVALLLPANLNGDHSRFRHRRFRQFLTLIDQTLATKSSCRIIDVGGTLAYWEAFESELRSRNVSILIVNLEPQGPDPAGFTTRVGDATDLGEFPDNSFDIVHSNSVIEHVGSRRNMEKMAGEVRRLAPAYFLQTPNFWFPYETHARTLFFHWMPIPLRVALHRLMPLGFYQRASSRSDAMACINDARCLSRSAMRSLFPDAVVQGEKFAGLNKSWIAIRQAAPGPVQTQGATLDPLKASLENSFVTSMGARIYASTASAGVQPLLPPG